MSIEGRIAIDVNFADSSDATGVQSLKKVSLVDTSSYTSGKVAIVTGTCGTSAIAVWQYGTALAYKDASGEAVDISTLLRIAVKATPSAVARGTGSWGTLDLTSNNDQPAISGRPVYSTPQVGGSVTVQTITGTASYTLVLYGT